VMCCEQVGAFAAIRRQAALLPTSHGTQPHPQKNRKSHPNIIN
jgi:hypothetical protein